MANESTMGYKPKTVEGNGKEKSTGREEINKESYSFSVFENGNYDDLEKIETGKLVLVFHRQHKRLPKELLDKVEEELLTRPYEELMAVIDTADSLDPERNLYNGYRIINQVAGELIKRDLEMAYGNPDIEESENEGWDEEWSGLDEDFLKSIDWELYKGWHDRALERAMGYTGIGERKYVELQGKPGERRIKKLPNTVDKREDDDEYFSNQRRNALRDRLHKQEIRDGYNTPIDEVTSNNFEPDPDMQYVPASLEDHPYDTLVFTGDEETSEPTPPEDIDYDAKRIKDFSIAGAEPERRHFRRRK